MARVLVLYASIDGQTARVAQRMAETLVRCGESVVLRAVAEAPAQIDDTDAVIVGGAIRYGHHPRELEIWVRTHRAALAAKPNAFFSVCMSAGGPGARPRTAQAYLDKFRARTGWQPQTLASIAGACLYTRYNPFIRFMMRLIVGMAGGETDTSRDYEYTDWPAVERFAAEFSARLRPAPAA
jgi:menaquinone-dependent protoporphyrinogen oxidase